MQSSSDLLRDVIGASPEKVRDAAAEGLTASEIADRLGVSRQRVHQLIKSHGIAVRKAYRTGSPPPSASPRIATNAANHTRSPRAIGTVAELIAAADLLARGWHVYMPVLGQAGHDIIAYKKDVMITVEVRPGTRKDENGNIVKWNKFRRDKSSHYAVVMIGEPVHYEPSLPDEPC